jgi:hypothetical protein
MTSNLVSPSRRSFLRELKILGGGAAVIGGLGGGLYKGFETIDKLLNPEEEIELYSGLGDPNSDYALFRESIFRFHKEQAKQNDGVLDLVYRANSRHGNTNIKGGLAIRAADLFNMLNKNHISTKQRGIFRVRYNGAMGLQKDYSYDVPVYVGRAN